MRQSQCDQNHSQHQADRTIRSSNILSHFRFLSLS
jgi:hypothetical protein